jgi:hypothetical protein
MFIPELLVMLGNEKQNLLGLSAEDHLCSHCQGYRSYNHFDDRNRNGPWKAGDFFYQLKRLIVREVFILC